MKFFNEATRDGIDREGGGKVSDKLKDWTELRLLKIRLFENLRVLALNRLLGK